MIRQLVWWVCLVGLGTPLLAQTPTEECGCDPEMTVADHIEEANLIIFGECVRLTTNAIKGGVNATFKVDTTWKRASEPVVTFHTTAANQCGFAFEKGKKYLVFGKKRHQTQATTVCEPNLPEGVRAEAVMADLGKGFPPGRPELARNMNILILGLGVGSILVIALIVLRKRLFKRSAQA